MTISARYTNVGTPLTIQDSGGTVACTLSSLAAASGRIAARLDLGAWPRATTYRWSLETAWVSAPVAGESLDAYFGVWDNDTGPASPWGGLAATDSALTITARANLQCFGSVYAETAGTGLCRGGGLVDLMGRYVSFAFYNGSAAKALAAVGTTPTILRLTPVFDEQQ